MRRARVLACMLPAAFAACASRPEAPAPRSATRARRCTLRISAHGILVDGEPMSRADAVAYCGRTEGALVKLEDDAPTTEWNLTRAALQREGVAIVMPGAATDDVPGRPYLVVPTPMHDPPQLVPASPK